jgi:hypothetical protein
MIEKLKRLSSLLCRSCGQTDYSACRSCEVHKLVNGLLKNE